MRSRWNFSHTFKTKVEFNLGYMNEESKKTFSITFTRNITIEQEKLEQLICQLQISNPFPVVSTVQKQEDQGKLRLAFTMKEAAEIIGVSYITVHRLIQRGLLKCSWASRKKIISKIEIERFLKETSRSAYER